MYWNCPFCYYRILSYMSAQFWMYIASTTPWSWQPSVTTAASWPPWTRPVASSSTQTVWPASQTRIANPRNCWPSIVIFSWRNLAKILKKLNWKTRSTKSWLSSSISRTKMCSRSSTAKCWPSGWSNTCRPVITKRPPWFPSWKQLADLSTPTSSRGCSRTLVCPRTWTRTLASTCRILMTHSVSTFRFRYKKLSNLINIV